MSEKSAVRRREVGERGDFRLLRSITFNAEFAARHAI